ncbi:MAG: tRNA lysidine(34) synthetase TilS [Porticoccaceae bacterium]
MDAGTVVTDLDSVLAATLASRPATRILIAYSGGMDSHVLLHLLWRRQGPEPLLAVHVNHGLSPAANHWEIHCRRTCDALGIACHTERVTVAPGPHGLEASARDARYAVFKRQLEHGELLVFGHHADDQAETLMYRLLRAGVPAGMPVARPLGRGWLLRPLLGVPRAALRDHAERHRLDWIEDESNAHLDFDRNYLRHRVLPTLTARWPDAVARLQRVADQSRAAADLGRDLATIDLAGLDERPERVGRSLSLTGLAALATHRQRNLLRHWRLPEATGEEPGARVLDALVRDLIGAAADAAPLVEWPGGQWRRFRNRLYLLPPHWGAAPSRDRGPWPWSPELPLALPDGAHLGAQPALGHGLRVTLPRARLSVRYRQGGERVHPQERGASNTLKRVLQEQGLEPWLRDRVPLIEHDGELVAVGDLFVCRPAAAGVGEPGWLPQWRCPVR